MKQNEGRWQQSTASDQSYFISLFFPTIKEKMKRETKLVISCLPEVPELERIVDEIDYPYLLCWWGDWRHNRYALRMLPTTRKSDLPTEITPRSLMFEEIERGRREPTFWCRDVGGGWERWEMWLAWKSALGHGATATRGYLTANPHETLGWKRHRAIGTTIAANREVCMVALQQLMMKGSICWMEETKNRGK